MLVAVGRRARTGGFDLEKLDLAMSGPFVRIDDQCATSMRNVWAIGDVTGEPMLAHRAMAQGELVAEIIAGEKRAFDSLAIPAICFTDPEIVAVGLAPEAAKAAHGEIRVGRFPFRANGRAMTLQDDEGFVRVVARADNNVVWEFTPSARASPSSRPRFPWRSRWALALRISRYDPGPPDVGRSLPRGRAERARTAAAHLSLRRLTLRHPTNEPSGVEDALGFSQRRFGLSFRRRERERVQFAAHLPLERGVNHLVLLHLVHAPEG